MASTRPEQPAFPVNDDSDAFSSPWPGLTKREYFAIKMLPVAADELPRRTAGCDDVADRAVEYADELIKRLQED